MKGVLRWLLGTQFDFMPKDVADLITNSGGDVVHGVNFTGNALGLSTTQWTTMFQYQEMIKFINEAIEWENVLFFLYSYFWDIPGSWEFIRQISASGRAPASVSTRWQCSRGAASQKGLRASLDVVC